MFEILGPRKDFAGRWVGAPRLNRLGLHPARIALSNACLQLRRRQVAPLGRPEAAEALARDGIAVLPRFLPDDVFRSVRDEVHARLDALAARHPPPPATERGFGPRQPFDGGFDRYDGGTLNRFVFIDAATPATAAAIRTPSLAALCRFGSGFRHAPERFWIYETRQGDERAIPDLQKRLHRDTFHSTVKLWLYLEEVRDEHGPLVYVPGSHRMTPARYRWEYARAVAASAPDAAYRGGSFRIASSELPALGLPAPRPYPVPANTLIIADVRGFHRRGDADAGARRVCLYASLRQWAFSPLAY